MLWGVNTHYLHSSNNNPFLSHPSETPTPTVISMFDCNLGIISKKITEDKCIKAQKEISEYRNASERGTETKITEWESLVASDEAQLKELSEQTNSEVNSLGVVNSQFVKDQGQYNAQLQATENMLNFYSLEENNLEHKREFDVTQLMFYKKYLQNITIDTGNGACSDHQGVDPIAGLNIPTDIGQVVCIDGWRGSSIFYFNVDKDIDYFLTTF